ncbi:MAG TPA: hypothetical protein VGC24_10555 [Burkholderiaceae bacterium]
MRLFLFVAGIFISLHSYGAEEIDYNCPQKQFIEFTSQKLPAASSYDWIVKDVPTMALAWPSDVDALNISNLEGVNKEQNLQLLRMESITKIHPGNDQSIAVTYDINGTEFFLIKLFVRRSGFHTCVPSSIVTTKYKKSYGSMLFGRNPNVNYCVWGYTFWDVPNGIEYTFRAKDFCSPGPSFTRSRALIDTFQSLISFAPD